MSALATDGQALAVTEATVAADLHQTLDILSRLATKVALDGIVCIDVVTQFDNFLFREVTHTRVRINAGLLANLLCTGGTDSLDVRQTNLNALFAWKVDTENTRQCITPILNLDAAYDGGFRKSRKSCRDGE